MTIAEEIKSRIDIVEVIGQYVTLQKAGRNFKALCPFHTEKTPSFHISPEKQSWYCFGACSTGGDVLTFVMKRENVDFPEALRLLAPRAGVTLSDRRDPQEEERHQRLFQTNEAAAAFYSHALLQTRGGEAARRYLTERSLDDPTIEAFQLGYSPDGWDALRSHLIGRGFSEEELLATGLLVESDRGGYDRFRHRLMFPIRDERGRIAGFGGRKLEGESADSSPAKYMNTPQTPMFDKGALLYGLDRAKETVRAQRVVIVVEGYMDVIAAHQHGYTNAVASMGTALTDKQIRTLERLRAKVLLAMDADAAGIEATLRALQAGQASGAVRAAPESAHPSAMSEEEFAEKVREWTRDGLKRAAVTFSVVPLSGKDPDELIRKDIASWQEAIDHARPFTEHVFETFAARKDLTQPAQRAELMHELLPVLRLIEEPVHHAHYLQRLARLTQVDEDVLRSELRRMRRPQAEIAPVESAAMRAQRDSVEEFVLALLLRYPELRGEGCALPPDLFALSEHRSVFAAWLDETSFDALRDALPEELQPHLTRILSRNVPVMEGGHLFEAFKDCVRKIELRRLTAAKRASTATLTDPETREDMRAVVEEARALAEGRTEPGPEEPSPAERDPRLRELAAALVRDTELGRRLHQATAAPRANQPAQATPPEDLQ
jgi:DNA primase